MRFISIDLETTGLDESWCQILEIGIVLGDLTSTPVDELPFLNLRLYYDRIMGEPYALKLNSELIGDMEKRMNIPGVYEYVHLESVWSRYLDWIDKVGLRGAKMTVAGKNYASFDRRFLAKIPRWSMRIFHHRVLDPGNLFWQPAEDDVLPDTKECIKRAGLDWKPELHTAVADARLVVELVRAGAKRR